MLSTINQKHAMSDNCICFFETLDGVLQNTLSAHFSYKGEISKEIRTYALPYFGLTPAASRCIPKIHSKYHGK